MMSHDGGAGDCGREEVYFGGEMVSVNAIDELRKELDRTGVISEDFKSVLVSWNNLTASQAYRRGVEAQKARSEGTGDVEANYENVKTIQEKLRAEQKLSQHRLDLLREHHGYVWIEHLGRKVLVAGKVDKCTNPDRFQRDCGECLVCRSIYTEGALVGTPDDPHAELRAQYRELM